MIDICEYIILISFVGLMQNYKIDYGVFTTTFLKIFLPKTVDQTRFFYDQNSWPLPKQHNNHMAVLFYEQNYMYVCIHG